VTVLQSECEGLRRRIEDERLRALTVEQTANDSVARLTADLVAERALRHTVRCKFLFVFVFVFFQLGN
jgi:hypothetical protein